MEIDAVVLAAKANIDKLASESDEILEANIDIAGKPMLSYVLQALEQLPEVSRIIVVGPEDGLSAYANERVIITSPGDGLLANVQIGLSHSQTEYVLVATSDIPLITSERVQEFTKGAIELDADFVYAVSAKEQCLNKYPEVQRTYVKLKGATLTGGNLFFVKKSIVGGTWPVVEKMIKYRKSPIKMASFFGIGFLLRIFLGLAGVPEIEEYVSNLLGIKCRAILSAPEIGIDVDKPQDLELARTVLGK